MKIPELVRYVCFTFGYSYFLLVNPFHYETKRPVYLTFTLLGCLMSCFVFLQHTSILHAHTHTEFCFVYEEHRSLLFQWTLAQNSYITNSLENNVDNFFMGNLGLVVL